ncbi:oxidoreductase [Priestia abyssalis]|uniref:oxidoreductase n=1 Tax=Priestia abyssalis TaxID=1221450 RepID=UPI0009955457|nr:oxidoreductase [Priestia abyssalis]
MKTLQVGLVGYGLSGQVFHAPFVHTHSHMNLKKVVERRSAKSKEHYPYVEVVASYEELLADEEIDVVIITTPNEFHFSMVKDAILKRKHVVIEKPFTVTSKEAMELTELAGEYGVKLFVYHNRRWDGDFKTVKKIIEQGLLGDIVEFESHFDRFRNYFKENAWREEDRPGSGILYDLGSHLIDQSLVLFGTPDAVTAHTSIQRKGGKSVDAFDVRLHYPEVSVTLKAGMLVRELGPRFTLHGTEGSFVKYDLDPQENALRQGSMPTDSGYGIEDEGCWGTLNATINGLHYHGKIETLPGSYQDFYQNVYEAVTEGKELEVKPEQGATVIRIIELAEQSAREKRTISFE